MMVKLNRYVGHHVCLYLPWEETLQINTALRDYVLNNAKWNTFSSEVVAVGMRYQTPEHRFMRSDKVTIRPHPNNLFDPHAIAIYAHNRHVGYLSKSDAQRIRKYIGAFTHVSMVLVRNRTASSVFRCQLIYPSFTSS